MDFQRHRPHGYTSLGDAQLPRLIEDLQQVLLETQADFKYNVLALPDREWESLAHVLVEFGEDIHNELGIWQSLEDYNLALFGTPLPLTLPATVVQSTVVKSNEEPPALEDRLRHLLWGLYLELKPELILSPTHQDLGRLAAVVANFLTDRLAKVRRQSGIKSFLTRRNKFGWDVKRKLIWLGQHSYLFRYSFQNYIRAQGGRADVPTIDQFICQKTTIWSGLGAIDILAALLPLKEAQRATLRSWYEPHVADYRVQVTRRNQLKLVNIINDEVYEVKIDKQDHSLKAGELIFGGLLPWDGLWYWSGEQAFLGIVSEAEAQAVRQSMMETAARIVYRYHKTHLEKAKESLARFQERFLTQHGDDLVIYPDGLSMAADTQKMHRLHNESAPAAEREKLMAQHGLTSAVPKMPYPPEIIQNENGLGVFFNPEEGTEIMTGFHDVLNGFKKRGVDLTKDEELAIEAFIQSEVISPHFVQRLVRDYGAESVAATFLIRDPQDQPYLAYLLRRYKGHFYRQRYPEVTLV